jgi:hypothetical protein
MPNLLAVLTKNCGALEEEVANASTAIAWFSLLSSCLLSGSLNFHQKYWWKSSLSMISLFVIKARRTSLVFCIRSRDSLIRVSSSTTMQKHYYSLSFYPKRLKLSMICITLKNKRITFCRRCKGEPTSFQIYWYLTCLYSACYFSWKVQLLCYYSLRWLISLRVVARQMRLIWHADTPTVYLTFICRIQQHHEMNNS